LEYADGSPTDFNGKWHGRFKKRTAKEAGYMKKGDFFGPKVEEEENQ
jgi:hypothetical protein